MRIDAGADARPWGLATGTAAAADIAAAARSSIVAQAAGRGQIVAVTEIFRHVFGVALLSALSPTAASPSCDCAGADEPTEPSALENVAAGTSPAALQVALSAALLKEQTATVWFLVRRLGARLPSDETAAAAVNAALAEGDAVRAAMRATAAAAAAATQDHGGNPDVVSGAPTISVIHVDDVAVPEAASDDDDVHEKISFMGGGRTKKLQKMKQVLTSSSSSEVPVLADAFRASTSGF
jgi:hypothetical protein